MCSFEKPRDERYRVHLSVRYGNAMDFVMEYAENLSKGGLFISGAKNLRLRQQVDVELELPGFGKYQVTAEVAHVLDPKLAAVCGRKPGAGLEIKKSPPGFAEALVSYLGCLGRRRDYIVLAPNEPCRKLLKDAGFQTSPVPPPSQLVGVVKRSKDPVIAVVVSKEIENKYAAAAAAVGKQEIVFGIDFLEELEELLPRLDEVL